MYTDRHQSRTWQRKLIEGARAGGHLDQLRWYIEMDVPSPHRLHPEHKVQCANYPPGFVPVIPVAWDNAEDWAHLLLEIFRSSNPGHIFRIMLTDLRLLSDTRTRWYDWGDPPAPADIDIICTACGLIGRGQPGQRLGCSRGCLAQKD